MLQCAQSLSAVSFAHSPRISAGLRDYCRGAAKNDGPEIFSEDAAKVKTVHALEDGCEDDSGRHDDDAREWKARERLGSSSGGSASKVYQMKDLAPRNAFVSCFILYQMGLNFQGSFAVK